MKTKETTLHKIEQLKRLKEELSQRKSELPSEKYEAHLKWQDVYLSNGHYTNLGKGTRKIERIYKKERRRLCREESLCKIKIKANEIKAAMTR
ncbi:MAG TPA: hypothetical protein GX747_02090 [Tenericutes bacterium]|nr:hypothetical protein [Mycoplasmatota bacterium]